MLSETNALGQKASYQYDSYGHRIQESNFSNKLQTTRTYDTNRRLRKEKERADQISHDTAFQYNFQDLLIQKSDHFNHSTYYFYDFIAKKVSLTVFPSIASADSEPISVVTKCAYDPFGRAVSKTNANGNTTTYQYNAYGDIAEALHPDGGSEKYVYAKDGTLLSYKDKDGLFIEYTRDVLGRVLSKTYIPNGEEQFTYSGFNLLTKTDLEGNVTKYTYDGAGRKIKEDYAFFEVLVWTE